MQDATRLFGKAAFPFCLCCFHPHCTPNALGFSVQRGLFLRRDGDGTHLGICIQAQLWTSLGSRPFPGVAGISVGGPFSPPGLPVTGDLARS